MTGKADLHIHTVASDGLLSPEEVVRRAAHRNLPAIAITDHDTIDGIPGAMSTAGKLSVEVIAGIELSTEYREREIHILGYFINHRDIELNGLLKTLQASRYRRAEQMVCKLVSMGYAIKLSSVLHHAGDAAPGRTHIARALVEQGCVENVHESFEKLIGFRKPAYVERFKITPADAIAVIGKAGGLAVWAHPGMSGDDSMLEDFIAAGLAGIEVYHPDHGKAQIRRYKTVAGRYALCITGGSDFHGDAGHQGRELGSTGLTSRELAILKSYSLNS